MERKTFFPHFHFHVFLLVPKTGGLRILGSRERTFLGCSTFSRVSELPHYLIAVFTHHCCIRRTDSETKQVIQTTLQSAECQVQRLMCR